MTYSELEVTACHLPLDTKQRMKIEKFVSSIENSGVCVAVSEADNDNISGTEESNLD